MDRMTLTIDIQANDVGTKPVNLRSSLLVSSLITTIKDKFNLDGDFDLRLENSRQSLPAEAPLDQAGVTDGAVLICAPVAQDTGTLEAIERGVRIRLSKNFKRVFLQEERNLIEYDLAWHPAIIGRRDRRNPSRNRLLAVDLDDLEEAPTVSRHHACITEENGSFFLESLNDHNPTYVGDTRLRHGLKYPLPPGSRIRIGRVVLEFFSIG
jgi:hypothetical protein